MATELRTRAGDVFPRLRFSADVFLDKTVILYGSSGSGKSVCIKNIMFHLRDHIDRVIVVSPTEPSNKTFAGTVDKPLIHHELYLEDTSPKKKNTKDDAIKGAIRYLERVWKLQEMMTSIYKRANEVSVINSLFSKIPDSIQNACLRVIDGYTRKKNKSVSRINAQYAHEPEKKRELIKGINTKYKDAIMRLYKKYIGKYINDITHHKLKLTEDEIYTLQYLEFNPRLLLILDDCAGDFKVLVKHPIVRKLFYMGRHVRLTVLISCQDDTDLPPNLKKNAFVSMYTEATITQSMFTRVSAGISKANKDLVLRSLGEIFVGYRKFAYIREDPSKQHFYIVDEPLPPHFRFGSPALHDLCDTLRSQEGAIDEKNPYYEKFKL